MSRHVLIAPDKFKGTLAAADAAGAIARGWQQACPRDHLHLCPMTDGGDGFGEIISTLLDARPRQVDSMDAAHRPRMVTWWWHSGTRTAVIEAACVNGLVLMPPGKFHPFQLDTFGLGTVIRAAVAGGARQIIIGIGGSATTDGGFGLARAFGWEFRDRNGDAIMRWTDLHKLARIVPAKGAIAARVTVAMDVQNLLLGARGAIRVYGPQKGLRSVDFPHAERCLRTLAAVMRRQFGTDFARVPGSGAAGGLGFGLLAFLRAKPEPGFAIFARLAGLRQRLRAADLVITGEGAIDGSTLMGKGTGLLAQLCREKKVPCIALAGVVAQRRAISRLFSETHALVELTSRENACARPALWLERLATSVAALIAADVSH